MSKWWMVINGLISVKFKKATFKPCIGQSAKMKKI